MRAVLAFLLYAALAPGGSASATTPAQETASERMATRSVSASGVEFAPGSGLRITSDDDRFQLAIGLRMQLRTSTLVSPKAGAEGGVDALTELTVRRARVNLRGHVFGEHNTFRVQLAFSPRDNGVEDNIDLPSAPFTPMRDAYMTFTHLRDLNVRIGQYKIPYSRERLVSSGRQQFVERSSTNAEFNLDRSVGLSLRSEDLFGLDLLRYQAGIFSIRGRGSAGYDPMTFVYAGRLELYPLGLFPTLIDADFSRDKKPRLQLAVAAAFEDDARRVRGNRGARPLDGGTTDITSGTADLLFFWRGLSVVGDAYLRHGLRSGGVGPTEAPRNGHGGRAQVGYLLPIAPLEIAARYVVIRGATQRASTLRDRDEPALGINWYIAEHALKLQADYTVTFRPDTVGPTHGIRAQVQGML